MLESISGKVLQKFGFLMVFREDINRPHHLLTVILKICYWEGSRSDDRINLFCQKLLTLIILGAQSPNNFYLWRKVTLKLKTPIYLTVFYDFGLWTRIGKCIIKYSFTSRSLSLSNSMPLLSSFLAIVMDEMLKRQQRNCVFEILEKDTCICLIWLFILAVWEQF